MWCCWTLSTRRGPPTVCQTTVLPCSSPVPPRGLVVAAQCRAADARRARCVGTDIDVPHCIGNEESDDLNADQEQDDEKWTEMGLEFQP